VTAIFSWAEDLQPDTIEQINNTANLPVVEHLAVMPDAHLGYGCCIGSVIGTKDAIIPSAVGVDIGCGMTAVKLSANADHLPDDLSGIRDSIAKAIPAGMGNGNDLASRQAENFMEDSVNHVELTDKQAKTALRQLGSLGSGNHFVEVSLDENNEVWIVLHSGSRGIGNQLAQSHIKIADAIDRSWDGKDADNNIGWLNEGTPEFDHYVRELNWAQKYAAANRRIMIQQAVEAFGSHFPEGLEALDFISCHHNYAEIEVHGEQEMFVTRKGAIRALQGDRGIVPGSMGTSTFIVEGLGHHDALASSAHGAGRVMSRNKARKNLSVESLHEAMQGRTWLDNSAKALLDEHPAAYKDIQRIMEIQDGVLTNRLHELTAIVNYKGA